MIKTFGTSTILLVEDNEANIIVIAAFLEFGGYQCDIARTGTEAIRMARSKFYDIILMDLKMPGMNGLEATQHIRANENIDNGDKSYIIGLTAHATLEHRDRCIELGMNDYLAKPMSSEQLLEKILFAEKKRNTFP